MSRRAALKQLARETRTEAGVYQIRNLRNGMILVQGTLNLKTINGKRMQLARGVHPNARLQADWNALGADAFVIEVLEVLQEEEGGLAYPRDAVNALEAAWIERLQPHGDRGYNPPSAGRPVTDGQ